MGDGAAAENVTMAFAKLVEDGVILSYKDVETDRLVKVLVDVPKSVLVANNLEAGSREYLLPQDVAEKILADNMVQRKLMEQFVEVEGQLVLDGERVRYDQGGKASLSATYNQGEGTKPEYPGRDKSSIEAKIYRNGDGCYTKSTVSKHGSVEVKTEEVGDPKGERATVLISARRAGGGDDEWTNVPLLV